MPTFKTVRGMRDFLPEEANMLKFIENKARRVAELYGYKEVVTPVVESYELLAAKAGEEVRSRMFVFKDLGGRDVALRPEFTASVARVVATTLRTEPKPLRLFSFGTVYRYDEPQKGRYREFWQSNYELMGSSKPEGDAEILMLTNSLMATSGLKKYVFKVGHVGVLRGIFVQEELEDDVQNAVMQRMDKKEYEVALEMVKDAGASEKCADVLQKLVTIKGSEIFEAVGKMKAVVKGYDKAVSAVENLAAILKLMVESECKMDVIVDAGFARGLEYYTGMIFEVYVPEFDIALGGGGRYDQLIELFGGEPTPAVGVAHGIDRIMLALQMQKAEVETGEKTVMVIPVKEELKGEALKISRLMREADVPVEVEVMGRKVTTALEDADRRGMSYAIIVGEKELKENAVVIRNLAKREQKIVKIEKIVETIRGRHV
ncbi:MAG: histidine--tRNA ligase [Candidatus Bathyarchaeota archaeon]|jgi:histidyl-tRNA synthetase|nr:histidine--tRNA ligase [Candidatus Bathyarchaeota archaeon A05DMB-5]MDH7557740.1 histidine--tRNA ligase [Candidatus Bathyarchaeota archaeon]